MSSSRTSQSEIEELRRRRQDGYSTVEHIEGILADPVVRAAILNLEPFTLSPSVVPEAVEKTADAQR